MHNLLSSEFVAQLYLQPPSVNFYRVSIQELDSSAYGGGQDYSLKIMVHYMEGKNINRMEGKVHYYLLNHIVWNMANCLV